MKVRVSDEDVAGLSLPAAVVLSADRVQITVARVVVLSALISAADGDLVIDIVVARAAGLSLFGAVRALAAKQIMKMLAGRPGLSCWKADDGNLRLRIEGWRIASAGIVGGVAGVRLIRRNSIDGRLDALASATAALSQAVALGARPPKGWPT